MRDCIVLGSSRSGTSMVAGVLARAGYFMGEALVSPRAGNPKGFFESPEICAINEALLASLTPSQRHLEAGQRWLAIPDRPIETADLELAERIAAACTRRPFCYEDPRFSFTLPAWEPHLGEARRVCVFRDPALTVQSIQEEIASSPDLAGLELSTAYLLRLWTARYRVILERLSTRGDWLFLHYDQVFEDEGLSRLETFLDAPVDREFPDRKLRRHEARVVPDAESLEVYDELCTRAGYCPTKRTSAATTLVSVLAIVTDEHRPALDDLVGDVRDQRGVQTELVLVDATAAGDLCVRGATLVRHPATSRGRALLAAMRAAKSGILALAVPGARWLPAHLAHALERLEAGADLVTCDLYLTDARGQFIDRAHPGEMGDAPGPLWQAGCVLRREALRTIDRRDFVPAELLLLRRLRAEGRALHEDEPGVTLAATRYEALWERSREDAAFATALERAQKAPLRSSPQMSVSLCTYQRRQVLEKCLEAFCRQTVPIGTFELVIVDDGSTDGTREWLDRLDLPVPARIIHRPNGGLAAARNSGLTIARGRYVLFVNDDTIPAPDLVERHLAAHAGHAGERLCILGAFHQPPDGLRTALMAHLEQSNEVFGFADLESGERYDGMRFWTCNVSAPLTAVREAGGFDPSFRHYGCEDTDLGLRLEQLGYRVLFEPRALAWHLHVLDLDDFARRQRTVARAFVRLFRKHPRALERWGMQDLGPEEARAGLAQLEPKVPALEAAARELSRIDVGALAAAGGKYLALAHDVLDRLASLIAPLNRAWWLLGYLEGFAEHRVAGLRELWSGGPEPHRFAADAVRRLLAWPRWEDPEALRSALERAAPAAGHAALVLRLDPDRDPTREAAIAALERAYGEVFPAGVEFDVILEEQPLDRAGLLRLGRSVDAWLPLGGEPEVFARAIVAEALRTPEQVQAWLERFGVPAEGTERTESTLELRGDRAVGGSHPSQASLGEQHKLAGPSAENLGHELGEGEQRAIQPALTQRAAPELSVVVPTRDRPRELTGLLERLCAQDIEPWRFELIVADDGSAVPVEEALPETPLPFEMRVVRQAAAGPAAARNLALSQARGELVLFLNDDAVPEPDLLRRHIAAHRVTSAPEAVVGTFALLAEHRRDSLAELVETTTILFVQPAMKPGVRYRGSAFCTGNLSVPRALVTEGFPDGPFDPGFPYAGGEDTELGMRLEREHGLRVRFEPLARCGHDHALEVEGIARRQRVLGWAAYRIQEHFPDAGLVEEWPLDDAQWEELRSRVDAEGGDAARHAQDAARLIEAERQGDLGPRYLAEVAARLESVRSVEFARGLLAARAGRLPLDSPFFEPAGA